MVLHDMENGGRELSKDLRRSRFECEYLVGDDSCEAVKESDMGALRAEACRNDVKDACCYLCNLRRTCDIRCDLPRAQRTRKRPENAQLPKSTASISTELEMECGNCVHYLKQKCPRGYGHGEELWRRQEPCELFQPTERSSCKP
jgi:hypothetical protein